LRVGKAWISLDSLVRIEPFQWVTPDFRCKKFLATFAPAPEPRERQPTILVWEKGTDWSWGELSRISDFAQ
jgi:hypothetical protein